jgi:type I restriction enzyme S subunit
MKPPTNNTPPQGYKMTELGALPEEWEVVRLGEVADFFIGRTPKRAEKSYWDNGKYSWISIADMKDFGFISKTSEKVSQLAFEKIFKENIVPKGTLIMSFKLTIGRTAILNIDALHNEAIISIYPKGELLKEFLFYFLPTIDFSNYYDNVVKGKTLNSSKIKNLLLPLPPLPEQQKIAAVLSAVQEAKEKTEAVIAAAKALKKSMMKHLFTYGPVSTEEAENVPLKETEIGPVPEDWEVVRLGEVAEISSGGTPSRKRNEYWIDGNIPWIKSEQCHDCYISVANEYITDLGLEDSSAKMLKKGTVLLAMVGATIGKTGFLTFEACTNQNIAGIFPINSLNNLFLYYALQSRYNEFEKIKGYGIANLSYLRQFNIPLPPLPIQQKIASILSAIDAKIEAEENKKKALEELFKSLLHNLMTANIRVNQLEITL